MVVRTQSDGRIVTGLYIGVRNARRNFPKHTNSIELQIGHLHIHCELPPEFWRGQPHIRDPRLCDWLEAKMFHGRSCRTPVPMAMIRIAKGTFRLIPFRLPSPSANQLLPIVQQPAQNNRAASKPPCSLSVCKPRHFIRCPVNFPR